RDDYGKFFFTILDYTGSASRHFADPDFDGEPALIDEQRIDDEGHVTEEDVIRPEAEPTEEDIGQEGATEGGDTVIDEPPEAGQPRKYYVDGGSIEIIHEVVSELDINGHRLRVIRYTDYAGEQVRNLYPSASDLRKLWAVAEQRNEIIEKLADRGIDFDELAKAAHRPDADPFDLLCHVAHTMLPFGLVERELIGSARTRKTSFNNMGRKLRQSWEIFLKSTLNMGSPSSRFPKFSKFRPSQ